MIKRPIQYPAPAGVNSAGQNDGPEIPQGIATADLQENGGRPT